MTPVCLYLLGAPRLEREGVPLTTDTRKAIALLAYLAVTARPHTRDTLATLLWGDADEQHARGALRRTLSVLRSAVGDGVVEISGDTVAAGPALWCDVRAFRSGLGRGYEERVAAVGLFGAAFMAGFSLRDSADFEEWQFLEGEALNRELAEALTQLAGELAAAGDYERALAHARRLLALDTLNEEAHRLLMTFYARNGDQSLALRQYRECVRVLEQELGVLPLAETTELYQRIRENRLGPPGRVVVSVPADAAEPELLSLEPVREGRLPALTGRVAEWAALMRAHERYAAAGYAVALEGEAGIGKTRLADDFLRYVQERGSHVAAGRGYEGEAGIAYGVVVQVLRGLLAQPQLQARAASAPPSSLIEVARLLPEAGAAPPAEEGDRNPATAARFLEGLRQFIHHVCAGATPAVLFFDDLQWADTASLDFLVYLVRRLAGQPLLVILAWQNDGSPEVERLRALMAESARSRQGLVLPLRRLQLADVLALVGDESAGGHPILRGLAGQIYHESEGVPLFVMAYLELASKGEAPGEHPLPTGVREVLAVRLRNLGETEHQLLQAASVLGRSFDLDLLQATSGRSVDETLVGLEKLAGRGLIHEVAASGSAVVYDFDHAKLRHLVYEGTSLARRRLLHERAGRALVAAGARRHAAEQTAASAAYHLAQAGQDADAAEQHVLAGRQAERVYANQDALQHYRSALAYGHPGVAWLHEKRGDLETLRGDYGAALAAYEAAAAHAEEASTEAGILEHKLGALHARLGDWEAAESFYAAANRSLASGEPAARAPLFADWSLAAYRRGDTPRASGLARHSQELAAQSGDARALAQAYNIEGILYRAQGDLAGAIASLEQSDRIARQLRDPGLQVAALNNLALACAAAGDFDRAIECLRVGLDACTRQGDRHREAALRNNLADVLHAAGRREEAMTELKSAVALFAEVGVVGGEGQAEIWKLTEW